MVMPVGFCWFWGSRGWWKIMKKMATFERKDMDTLGENMVEMARVRADLLIKSYKNPTLYSMVARKE